MKRHTNIINKQIVFATNSNSITTFQNNDSLQLDPIYLKLQSLDIINEDNQQNISFFNLSPQEQIAFFDELAIAEAQQMTEKIVGYPDIELDIKKQNELIGETIESFIDQSGIITDRTGFMHTIAGKLHTRWGAFKPFGSVTWSPFDSPYTVAPSVVLDNLKNANAKRGEFLVHLPKHDNPYVWLELSNKWSVGHVAVLTKNITSSTTTSTPVTIEAWMGDKVRNDDINFWGRKCYLMGLQNVTRHFSWSKGFYTIKNPVSNPGQLAHNAEGHLGKDYVKWYEFPVMKWTAPTRFTCTTLLWHGVKTGYSFNVGNWLSPIVTPSDIYLDANVRLITNIE